MERMTRILAVLAAAALPFGAALAGDTPVDPNGPTFVPDHQPVDVNGPYFVPSGPGGGLLVPGDLGNSVAQALQQAVAFCAGLPDTAYQVDCMAERIGAIAGAMPDEGPYSDAKAALIGASTQLRGLAATYADPAKRRKSWRTASGTPQATTRPLTAIAPENAAVAIEQAVAILDEAETVLLRSSAAQPAQGAQLQRIAAAVGSNKVLLRST